MILTRADDKHITELMTWFTDEEDLKTWGCPEMRFSFTPQSFSDDIKLTGIESYVLENHSEQMMAFGQYYLRLARCHVCRLAVKPSDRGQGIGTKFIAELCSLGRDQFDIDRYSLFVDESNQRARKLYHSLGFKAARYPGKLPLEGCIYMVS